MSPGRIHRRREADGKLRAMDTVLITGGTGHLGRDLVSRLKGPYRIRVVARSAGSDPDVEWLRGDLATGEGIADALVGTQTLIHAATLSPAARRGYFVPKDLWTSPSEVDREGTSRLLDLAAAAGVGHILYVSIVGIDRPRVPYLRRKLEAEYLVRQGPIPWSIARANGKADSASMRASGTPSLRRRPIMSIS